MGCTKCVSNEHIEYPEQILLNKARMYRANRAGDNSTSQEISNQTPVSDFSWHTIQRMTSTFTKREAELSSQPTMPMHPISWTTPAPLLQWNLSGSSATTGLLIQKNAKSKTDSLTPALHTTLFKGIQNERGPKAHLAVAGKKEIQLFQQPLSSNYMLRCSAQCHFHIVPMHMSLLPLLFDIGTIQ